MKGSLIIVSFFIVGTLCGLLQLIPYDFSQSKLSFYALCGLMFCVGISIGNDPQTLKSFRSLNPRLLFLPVMTILGTLAGCAVVSLFLSHRSPSDCMAVGSGFGYYSLSSIFIYRVIFGWLLFKASAAFEKLLYFITFTKASICLKSIFSPLHQDPGIIYFSCYLLLIKILKNCHRVLS